MAEAVRKIAKIAKPLRKKYTPEDANQILRKNNIRQGDYRAVRFRTGIYGSILVEFPAGKKLIWYLKNYRKIAEIAKHYGLELDGRWLRRPIANSGDDYAGYIGGSCIRINPFFENAGKLLEEIGELYGMHAK
jgi:hypothetical protein